MTRTSAQPLVRHRDDRRQPRLPQRNRLEDTPDAWVPPALALLLTTSAPQLARLEASITEPLAAATTLQRAGVRLTSGVGMGLVTAVTLLAALPALAPDAGARGARNGHGERAGGAVLPGADGLATERGGAGLGGATGGQGQAEAGDEWRNDAQAAAPLLWRAQASPPYDLAKAVGPHSSTTYYLG